MSAPDLDPAPESHANLEQMRDVAQGANEERAYDEMGDVEWGVGDDDTTYGIYLVGDVRASRIAAKMAIADMAAQYPDDQPLFLIRRQVGPWVEVTA